MKDLLYQQQAINRLIDETIQLLNLGGYRHKIVFDAPTGAGKTIVACQTLANLVDELKSRGDSRYQEVAFIWFAPRKLHLQSYASLKGFFGETRRLRPVMFDDLDQSEGLQPNEILFVNWESVNKENNLMVRDSESSTSLYEITRKTQEDFGLPIIAIIDEEHMFWSKTADKSAAVLDNIKPVVELRISATPKTVAPDALVKIQRKEVIDAGMIKKEVVLNPAIEFDFSNELELNENLIKVALSRRDQIAKAYEGFPMKDGTVINPLLLIQLPNDTKETMTSEDEAIAEQVKTYLRVRHGITEENGELAVWLANEKSNLAGLEKPNNMAKVLLFKEAIALGWDCPRAAVLLIFRNLRSDEFTIQTVGRILRMPEQQHYPNELLNVGYVYTNIAKEKIQIVTVDADYIFKNAITAKRRNGLHNVVLPAYYAERPNIERNYLGPDFRKTLYQTAEEFWKMERGAMLFSIAELASLTPDNESGTLPQSNDNTINENRRRVEQLSQNSIRLDVKSVNIEIPTNVHFQNEEQILNVNQVRYARKASEIKRVFLAYIAGKGNQFESKGRTDKIANFLLEMLGDYFGIFDIDAQKVVLHSDNQPKFDRLLERALTNYAEKRKIAKQRSTATRVKLTRFDWEIPEERVYDSETNHVVATGIHALEPFVQLNQASGPEKRFVEFLEMHKQYIDWWYKNGDKGKQHFAVPYNNGSLDVPFYVDFIIRMKNGHVYLFDTKTEGSEAMIAPLKHNGLLEYIKENTTNEMPLKGGVIVYHNNNWLYSTKPIENTIDTLDWDSFYPEKA